ncbi:MAG: glycosyl hydrolase family 18 protein [Defluviitaleaceae bacterium]|nr:glycosyl hydrolase family 18 protein [Defluviitaleaceae bacterium]
MRGSGTNKERAKRRKRRERRMLALIALFLISLVSGGIYLVLLLNRGQNPNMEFISVRDYNNIPNGDYFIFKDKIILENYRPLIIDGDIHLPLNFLRMFNGPHLHWEQAHNLVTLTTQTELERMPWQNNHIRNGMAYMSINNPIFNRFDIEVTEGADGFILINNIAENYEIATVNAFPNLEEQVPIRHLPNITSYVAGWVYYGADVYLFPYEYILNEETGFYERTNRGEQYGFTRVRTNTGEIGFIETVYLNQPTIKAATTRQPAPLPFLHNINEPITIAWDNVSVSVANYASQRRVTHRGVNVLAPKWLRFENSEPDSINPGTPTANIISIASQDYINWAHANGKQVWPLLFDYQNNYISSVILADPANRDFIIEQTISIANQFNFDGVMIDIEGLTGDNFENFAQFIRELSPFMRENNLVYSLAVFVPRWRPWHDHAELARVSDFLAVMAYDETTPIWRYEYQGWDEIGPNASISFVLETIQNILWQGVLPEQLILGIPFYTSIWVEEIENGEVVHVRPRRNVHLAYGQQHFINAGADIIWSDYYGSYFSTFDTIAPNGNILRTSAWIENERSLTLKVETARQYNLAGVAAWARTFETPPIWDAIYYALRQ